MYISGKARVPMLHFQHSKICPNFMAISQSLYIVMGTCCDCGILFLLLSWSLYMLVGLLKTFIKLQDF